MSMSSQPLLDVSGLTLTVDKEGPEIVSNATFRVEAGEIVAIVGESGSGKTMAVRSVLGLLPEPILRQEGKILFQGKDLAGFGLSALRAIRGAGIGMIFQEPMTSLNPALNIGKQLDEGLALHTDLKTKERKKKIISILERIGITDAENRLAQYPHEFSGGMRQRIMIAAAMLLRPKLILADEPTTALDALVQKDVLQLLIDLCRENDSAVLLISHDLPLVAEFAERVYVMKHGLVVEQGETEKILLTPQHPYTKRLLDALPRRSQRAPHPRAGDPIIKIEELEIIYPGRRRLFKSSPPNRAVRGIDIEIHPGEMVAIVGGSGSGKTTLGRAVVRLLQPSAGRILYNGRNIGEAKGSTLHEYRLKTQIVFQDPFSSLNPRMTIKQLVGEPLRLTPKIDRNERVVQTLEDVGLDADYLDRFPHQLSGGQRQRVAIARGIVRRPEFIVADEPVSALDMTVQKQVLELFCSLQKQYGFACLFITHDLAVVESLADWVVVMNEGKVVEQGCLAAVVDTPRDPYTVRLLSAIPTLRPLKGGGYRLKQRGD